MKETIDSILHQEADRLQKNTITHLKLQKFSFRFMMQCRNEKMCL